MKKLAFEGATNFEMPKMNVVGLEKESNVVFATGVSVYEPANTDTGFTNGQLRKYAQGEIEALSNSSAGSIY